MRFDLDFFVVLRVIMLLAITVRGGTMPQIFVVKVFRHNMYVRGEFREFPGEIDRRNGFIFFFFADKLVKTSRVSLSVFRERRPAHVRTPVVDNATDPYPNPPLEPPPTRTVIPHLYRYIRTPPRSRVAKEPPPPPRPRARLSVNRARALVDRTRRPPPPHTRLHRRPRTCNQTFL